MAFTFGRAINIHWKHGINALPEELQDEGGRISIIVWGWASCAVDEENGEAEPEVRPESFSRPCLQYQGGKCTYGERCKFVHQAALEGDREGNPESGPEGRPGGAPREASLP
uniref:C3H1-type domain-containing protein n=2 Tax=Alexandrium catenella TaxID=2925 RepID=A0A7S1SEF9_ALECA|mmetsp:Transcript_97195/g.258298  ORF Transcript_97195/g.258298 Transcript_97195/m.258298 type:complete len:112 (+) Transcript_97195:661-996(+)